MIKQAPFHQIGKHTVIVVTCAFLAACPDPDINTELPYDQGNMAPGSLGENEGTGNFAVKLHAEYYKDWPIVIVKVNGQEIKKHKIDTSFPIFYKYDIDADLMPVKTVSIHYVNDLYEDDKQDRNVKIGDAYLNVSYENNGELGLGVAHGAFNTSYELQTNGYIIWTIEKETEPEHVFFNKSLEFHGSKPEPRHVYFDTALEFHGDTFEPNHVYFDTALKFHGGTFEPSHVYFDTALEFHGGAFEPNHVYFYAALEFHGGEKPDDEKEKTKPLPKCKPYDSILGALETINDDVARKCGIEGDKKD